MPYLKRILLELAEMKYQFRTMVLNCEYHTDRLVIIDRCLSLTVLCYRF
jgi:hypothetical protein